MIGKTLAHYQITAEIGKFGVVRFVKRRIRNRAEDISVTSVVHPLVIGDKER